MDATGQRPRESVVRRRATSLANLLVVFRSAAHLYPTRQSRRERVLRWLDDIRFNKTARDYTLRLDIPHSVHSCVLDFCLGHIGARTFGERLFEAFRDTNDGRKYEQTRQLIDSLAVSTTASKAGHVTTAGTSDNRLVSVGGRPPSDLRDCRLFWYSLYDRLRVLTAVAGFAGNVRDRDADEYDARIEFARELKLDSRYGSIGAAEAPCTEGFVVRDECYITLSSLGHFSRSMGARTTESGNSDTSTSASLVPFFRYPVFVFGSNCVWIDSDAVYTSRSPSRRPSAFENDQQIVVFGRHLVTVTGINVVPDVLECRRVAVATNRPVITSVSRNDVSLQMTFAMPDSLLYTADVFYLSGGNTCTTDFRYRRQCLSNVCKCEDNLSLWRVCVSVAAFDGSKIGTPPIMLSKFVTDLVRSFYLAKAGERNSHFYINAFTGLALIDYVNDSTALGGMTDVGNSPDSPAATCRIHNWLRGHASERYWHSVSAHYAYLLLRKTPMLLVVCRPLVSEMASLADGPNVFLQYKTFEDVVVKYVSLTLYTLRRGYGNTSKGVAYKARDCFWLFSDTPDQDENSGSEGPPTWLRAVDGYAGGIPLFDVRRDLDDLFRLVFSAPSRLYVDKDALTEIGFNVTAVEGPVPARCFTHTTDSHGSDGEENRCTVFCSSPLVVMDGATFAPVEIHQESGELRILTRDERPTIAVEVRHGVSLVKTRTVSLDGYWPGVDAVKTTFVGDSVLENVEFVYFIARDGDNAVGRLTAAGLSRLARDVTNDHGLETISLPVLFGLRWMIARLETVKS